MIDDIRKLLAEIKEREAAATPGPWTRDWSFCDPVRIRDSKRNQALATAHSTESDATFIAAARTDIPRLVQALEAMLPGLSAIADSVQFGMDGGLRGQPGSGLAKAVLADALAALKGEGK